jgi:two-component system sensor histidine kinase AlgZ
VLSPIELRRAPAATFLRELAIAALVALPASVYALATNVTAAPSFILLHVALLVALTPLAVVALEARFARVRSSDVSPAIIARDVIVRLASLAASTGATLAVIHLATGLSARALLGAPLVIALVPVFLAYALVATAGAWMRLREHALRAAAHEARARQAALAARVRPHFLFNALNGIEELTALDPAAAREAIGGLARMLRAVLESSAEPRARLADEARLVEDYLAIERIRFGARMTYEIGIPRDLEDARVPSTALLTLAENAVKHGVEATRDRAKIALHARRSDRGGTRVTMTGPKGAHPAPRSEAGLGYGLADVRERLALAYGGEATLTLREDEEEVHVELDLPV